MRVSGIFPGAAPWLNFGIAYALLDYHTAHIHGKGSGEDDRFLEILIADLDWPHENRKYGDRVGYPIHSDCWLLLDRTIGHEVINEDLRLFVKAVEMFWSTHTIPWIYSPLRIPFDDRGIKDSWARSWPDVPSNCRSFYPCFLDDEIRSMKIPGSPYRIPDIDRLIAHAIRAQDRRMRRSFKPRRTNVSAVPPEIRMMIVEAIYCSRCLSQARVKDVRCMLNVFGWKLPDSFWQNQCNPELVFELADLIEKGVQVDWAEIFFGLEGLLMKDNRHWYRTSGLANRARALIVMGHIKEQFESMVG